MKDNEWIFENGLASCIHTTVRTRDIQWIRNTEAGFEIGLANGHMLPFPYKGAEDRQKVYDAFRIWMV